MNTTQQEILHGNQQVIANQTEGIAPAQDYTHPWETSGMLYHLKRILGVRKLSKADPFTHDGIKYTFDFFHKSSYLIVKIFSHLDVEEIIQYKALPFAEHLVIILDTHAICGEPCCLFDIPEPILKVVLETDVLFSVSDGLRSAEAARIALDHIQEETDFITIENAWTVGDSQDYDNDSGKQVLLIART